MAPAVAFAAAATDVTSTVTSSSSSSPYSIHDDDEEQRRSSSSSSSTKKALLLRELVGDVGMALFAPLDIAPSSEEEQDDDDEGAGGVVLDDDDHEDGNNDSSEDSAATTASLGRRHHQQQHRLTWEDLLRRGDRGEEGRHPFAKSNVVSPTGSSTPSSSLKPTSLSSLDTTMTTAEATENNSCSRDVEDESSYCPVSPYLTDSNSDDDDDGEALPMSDSWWIEPEEPRCCGRNEILSSELSVDPLQECPRIFSASQFAQIREALPSALRQNKWERCFAIGRDGDSMITLLDRCTPYTHTVLVVQTTKGDVLGGYATECWNEDSTQLQRNNHNKGKKKRRCYYGTGQSFLFGSNPDNTSGTVATRNNVSSDGDDVADGKQLQEPASPSKPLSFYRWTGDNDYCQICCPDRNRVAMGGDGDFGFVVQDYFSGGWTGRCRTYENPPLVPTNGGDDGRFEVAALEVYGIVPLFESLLNLRQQDRS